MAQGEMAHDEMAQGDLTQEEMAQGDMARGKMTREKRHSGQQQAARMFGWGKDQDCGGLRESFVARWKKETGL
ncbi:hypothetical protein ACOMHN_043816 [Nucella lapillus]